MKQQDFSNSLRLLKVKYGLRFVVSKVLPGHIVLIVLNRKAFDSFTSRFLTDEGIKDYTYDRDEKLASFYLNGVKFSLLGKEGCG
ncbi:MAG: hypothetical protein HQK88_06705 [Nitrospirae bacterium]|nr:hypothetical protein [Nitrospirota bacterium]MBF0534817.1 hypothetical protein [Nitrospirota bacterium]MBF0616491.1 hypothetical protein [Nitrospirota bacterium]